MVNNLAVVMGNDLSAACRTTAPAGGGRHGQGQDPLLIHYAQTDERINAMWPRTRLPSRPMAHPYAVHFYPGTQHGFHNNSTPRYNEAAAKLSWDRTIEFFKQRLS
jgi:carboxymethylenebutenolidase